MGQLSSYKIALCLINDDFIIVLIVHTIILYYFRTALNWDLLYMWCVNRDTGKVKMLVYDRKMRSRDYHEYSRSPGQG